MVLSLSDGTIQSLGHIFLLFEVDLVNGTFALGLCRPVHNSILDSAYLVYAHLCINLY